MYVLYILVSVCVATDMKFITQPYNIEIIDVEGEEEQKNPHSPLFPGYVRALACGRSGSGKTSAILSLLTSPNGLCFKNVYVYSKSLHQPKYQFLRSVLEPMKGIGYYTFSENDDVIPPSKARPHSIFIFDDVSCERQQIIKSYFTMGRHFNINVFYLCQSYAHAPKQLVRDNLNFIILFNQDDLNLKHIYSNHVNTDMSYAQFKDFCTSSWSEPFNFVVIDKDSPMNKGRYRRNFNDFAVF